MDFAIGLVNHVFHLLEGQVNVLENFKLQKICNQCCSSNIFLGYLKDSWASTYQQQLARMASCKTDFLRTLHQGSVVLSNTFYKMAHKHEQGTIIDFLFFLLCTLLMIIYCEKGKNHTWGSHAPENTSKESSVPQNSEQEVK